MKKFLMWFFTFLTVFLLAFTVYFSFWEIEHTYACSYNSKLDVLNNLDKCFENKKWLVEASDKKDVQWNINFLKERVIAWSNILAGFFGLIAIWALIYASFQMVTSAWVDEKITSAKKTFRWAIYGLIIILLAAWIVRLIVAFIYSIL